MDAANPLADALVAFDWADSPYAPLTTSEVAAADPDEVRTETSVTDQGENNSSVVLLTRLFGLQRDGPTEPVFDVVSR